MGIPVTGVSELVLEVVDLEASEAFYAGILGLPVVDRWPDRDAIWVMAGDRTRIGLWRPQVGLERGRGGVHVHFAMHIAEADYDSAVTRAARRRPRRPRARVRHPPALPRGLRRRPRRPPRRALDLGRGRPPSTLSPLAVEALARERAAGVRDRRHERAVDLDAPCSAAPNLMPSAPCADAPQLPSSTAERVISNVPCVRIRSLSDGLRGRVRRPRQRRVEHGARRREVSGSRRSSRATVSVSSLPRFAGTPIRSASSRGPSRLNVYSTIQSRLPVPTVGEHRPA